MAKKYYWLKLKNDFFDSKEMKKLRKIAGGETYTIIYLKMQLLSLKDEGKLFYDGVEESFADEIALEINEDAENVRFTILFLEKVGLLEKQSDDEFLLTNVQDSIGSETDKAQIMRNKRKNSNKSIEYGNNVTAALPGVTNELPSVTKCYTELEYRVIDRDTDIGRSRVEKEKKKNATDAATCYDKIEKAYFTVTGRRFTNDDKKIVDDLLEYGHSENLIVECIKKVTNRNHGKINTVKYFVPIIEEAASKSASRVETMYPSTYSPQDIEEILNAEYMSMETSDEEYIYDD